MPLRNPRPPHGATVAVFYMNTSNALKSVADLAKLTVTELVAFFAVSIAAGRVAYLNASHALIALVDQLGSEAKAVAALKAGGADMNDVKNALRHVAVYDAVVRPGHASLEWFDGVTYMDAVAINRAVARVGIKQLVEWESFDRPARNMRAEFELIADTGKNKVQRLKAAEKAAEKAAAEAPEVETAKKAATAKNAKADATKESAGKPTVTPMAEFDATAEKLEHLATGILAKCDDVTKERIVQRILALGAAVEAAVNAKSKKQKSA